MKRPLGVRNQQTARPQALAKLALLGVSMLAGPSRQARFRNEGGDAQVVAAGEPSAFDLNAKRSSLRSRLLTGLLLAVGLTVLAGGIAIRVADLHLAPVLSNSMQPAFSAGDLVITQTVPISSIRVGDVITFVPPGGGRSVIHRITSMQDGVVTTRGDANSTDDPWRATLAGPTTDRLVAVLPYAGWLTELQRPALLLAGLLAGLAFVIALWKGVKSRFLRFQSQPKA
ncbi:MAG TPA: signal peptidase I [Candidatus Limnocylindrales bacterium]